MSEGSRMNRIVIPKGNENDLEEIPKEIRGKIE